MIVSISGQPGSGKSTVAKKLAKEFGLQRYYIGGIRRQMAKERGLTLQEFNRLGEKEDFTDKEVDQYQKKLGQTEDNFVIEGRTSCLFIPNSIKIFLEVDEKVGAERIFDHLKDKSAERNEGRNLDSVKDVLRSNQARMKSDKARYLKWYQQDPFDRSHYDCIIDTTDLSMEEEYQAVKACIQDYQGKNGQT